MNAMPPIRCRITFGNRGFADLLVWKVLEPAPLSRHGFKYRLAYIVDGRRVVCFDYERGKGDHRHLGDHEEPYRFTGVDELVTNFLKVVAEWRKDHGRE